MSPVHTAQPYISHMSPSPLRGKITILGDKSISHRALILGSLATGITEISGLLESADIHATVTAMSSLGAEVTSHHDGTWTIRGRGTSGLMTPNMPLNFGNSGTSIRLIMGAITGCPIQAECYGDISLSQRPMGRVITPLEQMGARFELPRQGGLPLTIRSPQRPLPIRYTVPIASAQVKSAILLAGLGAPGITTVIESTATRTHTEHMLRLFGAEVTTEETINGREISLVGECELVGTKIIVPGDPSSAAFPLVAALLVPDSDIVLENILCCPHRNGLWQTLQEMGASITALNRRKVGGETIADFRVKFSVLKGVEIPAERVASMIDEYPILAMAAACAEGQTKMHGLAELRVKESDRFAVIYTGLKANGVQVEEIGDSLIIEGTKGHILGGGEVSTHFDHRMAMSFLVLGLVSQSPIYIDDTTMIETSFPNFFSVMSHMGAKFEKIT